MARTYMDKAVQDLKIFHRYLNVGRSRHKKMTMNAKKLRRQVKTMIRARTRRMEASGDATDQAT